MIPSKPNRSVTLAWLSRCSTGPALLHGSSVDEGSGQGSATGADRLGAAPSPSHAVTSLPPAAQPGTSPQVTSGVRSKRSSPSRRNEKETKKQDAGE